MRNVLAHSLAVAAVLASGACSGKDEAWIAKNGAAAAFAMAPIDSVAQAGGYQAVIVDPYVHDSWRVVPQDVAVALPPAFLITSVVPSQVVSFAPLSVSGDTVGYRAVRRLLPGDTIGFTLEIFGHGRELGAHDVLMVYDAQRQLFHRVRVVTRLHVAS